MKHFECRHVDFPPFELLWSHMPSISSVKWTWSVFGHSKNSQSLHGIMCEDPAWIEIHWNSIWSRARSHMTSHYNWGAVTTLHHSKKVLERPLNTFLELPHFFDEPNAISGHFDILTLRTDTLFTPAPCLKGTGVSIYLSDEPNAVSGKPWNILSCRHVDFHPFEFLWSCRPSTSSVV